MHYEILIYEAPPSFRKQSKTIKIYEEMFWHLENKWKTKF